MPLNLFQTRVICSLLLLANLMSELKKEPKQRVWNATAAKKTENQAVVAAVPGGVRFLRRRRAGDLVRLRRLVWFSHVSGGPGHRHVRLDPRRTERAGDPGAAADD